MSTPYLFDTLLRFAAYCIFTKIKFLHSGIADEERPDRIPTQSVNAIKLRIGTLIFPLFQRGTEGDFCGGTPPAPFGKRGFFA